MNKKRLQDNKNLWSALDNKNSKSIKNDNNNNEHNANQKLNEKPFLVNTKQIKGISFYQADTKKDLSEYYSTKSFKSIKNKNSVIFYGSYLYGLKNGFGIQKWNDTNYFQGIYKNNKANGIGKLKIDDEKYYGEFLDDKENGYGIYYCGDEKTIEGYWINDSLESIGIEKFKDKSLFRGEFKNGKKSGIGELIWSKGTRYEGEWKDDKINGFGIYHFLDNKEYQGHWKDNLKDGYGEFSWVDKKYVGYYLNDLKNGFGIYFWKNIKKAFIGFWKKGKKNGFGKLLYKGKDRFGIWSDKNENKLSISQNASEIMNNSSNDKDVYWIKNDQEALAYIKENNLINYEHFFQMNIEDLYNNFLNNDEIGNNLEKINSKKLLNLIDSEEISQDKKD